MWRRRITGLLVLVLAALAGLGGCAAERPQLRVLSYNIHHGEGMDDRFDLPRLAQVIEAQQPDLVSLQEVDRETTRASGADQAAELGRLTGMHAAYGPAMDYAGGEYGVAILSRLPFVRVENHPLPHTDGYEPRTALAARVDVEGIGEVVFIATHFQHNLAADRTAQASAINDLFVGEDATMILVGDLNAEPGSEPMETLRRYWEMSEGDPPRPTFPSSEPRKKIDYVLLRPPYRWIVVESRVIDEPVASDHCPLLVVLEWADKPMLPVK
jgi:endonuclease/exonuclease/phosphatase family metal-dependent hydrolase